MRAPCSKNGTIHECRLLSKNTISPTTSKNTCTSPPHIPSTLSLHASTSTFHGVTAHFSLDSTPVKWLPTAMYPADSGFLSSLPCPFPFVHYILYIYTSLWSVGGAGLHTSGDPENHIPNTSPAHANSLSRHIIYPFYLLSYAARFLFNFHQRRLCLASIYRAVFFLSLIRSNIPESSSGTGLGLLIIGSFFGFGLFWRPRWVSSLYF